MKGLREEEGTWRQKWAPILGVCWEELLGIFPTKRSRAEEEESIEKRVGSQDPRDRGGLLSTEKFP